MKNYLMNVLAIALCATFCNVVAAASTGSAGDVTSTNTVKKIGPQTYDVRMTALIGSSFHLCSQDSGINGSVADNLHVYAEYQ
ncbi:hypothetical protein [Paraburkholderia atlantica]|uniref:hypothetical protein n=1 Tax=Paraburkholderia atlantica TaxID=2654982 RepID=UPI00160B66CD|nr:hypothetical protein [Paraburkholderia atlantica]MBB5511022.1 hypothetical protein [Paraburkholderia atlantica]